jgi:hypothetical protein
MVLTWVEVFDRLAEMIGSIQQPEDQPQFRLIVDEQSSPPNVKIDARANRGSEWVPIGALPAPADETPELPVGGGGLGSEL